MKKFTTVLLSVISVISIVGSVQFVAADHLEPGIGIFKNGEHDVNLISTRDSKYQIYLQVEVRNVEGQLISISESNYGSVIPHKITDLTFDEKLGKKEIITIGDTKYEKALYRGPLDVKQMLSNTSERPHFIGLWKIQLCGEVDGHEYRCMAAFQANTALVSLTEEDVVINQWTILRIID